MFDFLPKSKQVAQIIATWGNRNALFYIGVLKCLNYNIKFCPIWLSILFTTRGLLMLQVLGGIKLFARIFPFAWICFLVEWCICFILFLHDDLLKRNLQSQNDYLHLIYSYITLKLCIRHWIKLYQCDKYIKDISEYLPEFAHRLELSWVWHTLQLP